jgi:hypothetical protein
MKRALAITVATATFALSAPVAALGHGAQLPSDSASCAGILANASNPNASGTFGANGGNGTLVSSLGQQHSGGLDDCVALLP